MARNFESAERSLLVSKDLVVMASDFKSFTGLQSPHHADE
jgi:hypothetical protein